MSLTMKADPHPCRGDQFSSQVEAAWAIEVAKRTTRLTETPYAYVCTEGHWHVSVQYA